VYRSRHDHRSDFELATDIVWTAISDPDAPGTVVGYIDGLAALWPPTGHILAMYQDPKVHIVRKPGRALDDIDLFHEITGPR
jgi:hypothetical protein